MDVPGQDKRVHKRARICPVSGKGLLSKSARERFAREIIAKSGADTEEYFNKVVRRRAVDKTNGRRSTAVLDPR